MSQDVQTSIANSWEYYMRTGNFEAAWKCSDKALGERTGKSCWHLPRHYQYIWNGSSLKDKRVFIRCYHGLGDTIQFIRFVPLVKKVVKKVMVWAQPKLIPLLKTMQGIDQLLPLHDGSPEVEYDTDVELMELPHIFRTTMQTLPAKVPYLHVKPLHIVPKKNDLHIGLVWKAGDWDEKRNIPFSVLLPLANIPHIKLYILQANATEAGWQQGFGINISDYCFMEQARIIKGLDLMISADSMPAHLAGALGVPVWNLLQYKADWRWMNDRENSPWYPTMRLFRQEEEGDWDGVVKRVYDALKQMQITLT